MIKLLIVILFVIGAFALMLFGMFFGDYKKVRTKHKREKSKIDVAKEKSGFSSCAGCTGTDCNN